MASKDLVHSIKCVNSNPAAALATFAANAVTTSASTTTADTLGWESVTVVGRVHTDTLASGSIIFLAQDSADNSTFATIAGTPAAPTGVLLANTTNNGTNQIIGGAYPAAIVNPFTGTVVIGISDCRRYVSGAYMGAVSFTGLVSTDVILGNPRHRLAAV